MEEYIQQRVEERLDQELDALFGLLERELPSDEFRRVLEIAASPADEELKRSRGGAV